MEAADTVQRVCYCLGRRNFRALLFLFASCFALVFPVVTSVRPAPVRILVHRGKSIAARNSSGHGVSVFLEPDSFHMPTGGGQEFRATSTFISWREAVVVTKLILERGTLPEPSEEQCFQHSPSGLF